MPTSPTSPEKYFDDGIAQYWRLCKNNRASDYRITVQPSGVTIDELSLSWNNRRSWKVVHCDFRSFEHAKEFLITVARSVHPAAECETREVATKGGYFDLCNMHPRVSQRLGVYGVA